MYKVAITGVMGSGKSTAGRLLTGHALPFISLDLLAKKALSRSSGRVYQKMLSLMGKKYLNKNKSFNRALVAKRVFKSQKLLSQIETIIHPAVLALMTEKEEKIRKTGEEMIFYEVPLLFEKHLEPLFDFIIVIAVHKKQQKIRLKKDRRMTIEDIEARQAHQINQKEKIKKAHHVIWNNADVKNLEQELIGCVKKLYTKKT